MADENGYPIVIEFMLSNGNSNKCKVVYWGGGVMTYSEFCDQIAPSVLELGKRM